LNPTIFIIDKMIRGQTSAGCVHPPSVSLSIKPEVDEMLPTDIVEMLSPSSS